MFFYIPILGECNVRHNHAIAYIALFSLLCKRMLLLEKKTGVDRMERANKEENNNIYIYICWCAEKRGCGISIYIKATIMHNKKSCWVFTAH